MNKSYLGNNLRLDSALSSTLILYYFGYALLCSLVDK